VIQVDVRGERIGRRVPVTVPLVGTVADTVKALLPIITAKTDTGHLDRMTAHYRRARARLDKLARTGATTRRYYFLPDHETITRRVEARTKTGRAQSAKKVVRQEGERTDHPRDIWWHPAAQLRFEQFAPGSWGLTIRPGFHLTKDGRAPLEPWRVGRKVTRLKSHMYNEGYFDAVHFFRYFLLDGRARFTLKVGRQAITVDGNFPEVNAKWPEITDKRFDPISMLGSGDEDDVLDALAGTLDFEDEDEWDWGAEHSEDDR
jgi:hypothetical protein